EIVTLKTTAAEGLYVEYARQLDDGEAMSLALVRSHGFVLATDDRKARRVLAATANNARLISTAGILRQWAERQQVSRERLRDTLRSVTTRAKFIPPTGD